ncbi:hypothetical protein A1O3_06686 [Capronia epimyces CBS 606.96]|uniref:Uncharacterized protein n=1 Tax=Capronia epimyces CBS 606.96 TaxID=1182542 RepID=W9Y0Y7_9EURO|nr:uncharacterized protein A1O3_06686 [Capronia epimyces CBS 606.96]EXJ82871.1 hypothetical protein A1O3_06686 [Capronia epimyces CBS 606.96]
MTVSRLNPGLMGANTISCEEVEKSSLYTMIPSVVRSRIPVLPSLRHSVVLHASQVRRMAYTLSCVDAGKEKESCGFASTVPSSGASTPMMRPESPEENPCSGELGLKLLSQPEARSGVDWDIAATGVRLWISAKAQADEGGDPAALRSMHVDALRYMHMALPPDLTPLEMESLRASMSPQLIFSSAEIRELDGQRRPNLLRQTVAQAICWLVATFLLLIPVLMTLLTRVLQFERQHQVTERIITNSLDMTSSLGERGLDLHNALRRFKDGRVGAVCLDAGSWFAESILGGVNDGIDAASQSRRKTL